MYRRFSLPNLCRICWLSMLSANLSVSALAASPDHDAAHLQKIRTAAMSSDYAYQRLADMTDLIGPRLSGSAGAAAAVTQVADAMRQLGARVTLEPVKVPHWVRGAETAELIEYAGRPAGLSQKVILTALGGSGATADTGLTAEIIVVHNFDELQARAPEVKGRIVLFDVPFNQAMADRGLAGPAYGEGAQYRSKGPKTAAKLGAVAALVRSVGGANFRLAHTGATSLDQANRIPAAAVTAEDAMLISRLAARGAVSMHLTLTPQILADADSFNVIADWPGSDKADEIVIVSGHLDSWDLGTGAIDDGAGVAAAMGVIETLQKLGLKPRRTIRMIAWMNEENGGRGALAYQKNQQARLDQHIAAIESDSGAGRPFGLLTSVPAKSIGLLTPLMTALQPIGAAVLKRADALDTGDLSGLEEAGVPSFEPLVDTHDYFHYHHTSADTLDKVQPENLRRQVALLTTTAWFLANLETPIGRAATSAK
ncbi:M20/M25/M40 family metallo-hydrolase [Undibacterium sp. Ren11W]|uniref:M20/M25/M40 family metallo-hydrolase n=1 Tax=Undibacterium sp. Ren11W TaxID=3413045 RepID=UPI003BEF953A